MATVPTYVSAHNNEPGKPELVCELLFFVLCHFTVVCLVRIHTHIFKHLFLSFPSPNWAFFLCELNLCDNFEKSQKHLRILFAKKIEFGTQVATTSNHQVHPAAVIQGVCVALEIQGKSDGGGGGGGSFHSFSLSFSQLNAGGIIDVKKCVCPPLILLFIGLLLLLLFTSLKANPTDNDEQ